MYYGFVVLVRYVIVDSLDRRSLNLKLIFLFFVLEARRLGELLIAQFM